MPPFLTVNNSRVSLFLCACKHTKVYRVSELSCYLLEKECSSSFLLGTMRHLDHGVVSPPCDQPIHGTDPRPVQDCTALEGLDLAFRHRHFCLAQEHMRLTFLAIGIPFANLGRAGVRSRSKGSVCSIAQDGIMQLPGKDRSNIPAPGNWLDHDFVSVGVGMSKSLSEQGRCSPPSAILPRIF